MISAASDADPASSVDLSVILLTALGGAIVAALAGLLGAWLQSRREHDMWVRERRFEAYTLYMQVAQRYNVKLSGKTESLDDEVFLDEMISAEAAVDLLGPKEMRDLTDEIRSALLAWEDLQAADYTAHSASTWQIFEAFEKAAQTALKIKA
jgi:hypothetical protein